VTVALLDANVLLRFLTRDDPVKADKCRALLLRAARGQVELLVTSLTFAEIVWVLESYYKAHRDQIVQQMLKLLALSGVTYPESLQLKHALRLYADTGIDFIDAYQAAHAASAGIERIYSYDRHFDRVPELDRRTP